MITKYTLGAALGAALLLQTPQLLAQDATPSASPAATAAASPSPDNGGGNGGGGFRRGGGNFADFRQRMNDRLKGELKATDDEWAVIQPLLEKVQDAQMATMAGRFGGMRRFGGNGGGPGGNGGGGPGGQGGGPRPDATTSGTTGGQQQGGRPRFTSPEADALRDALQNENTSPDDIKTKLQALRDSRKKADDDLATARDNLKKVLTLRQEATLVQMGLLD